MRFTDAYAACPVCSPTRAAHHDRQVPAAARTSPTGCPAAPDRPDQRLTRPAIRNELPLEEVTIAEALKAAGYVTGAHRQVAPRRRRASSRTKQGFDVNIAGDQTGTPRSYFAPFEQQARRSMPGPGEGRRGRVPDRPPRRRGREVHRGEQGQAVLPLPAALRRPHAAAGEAGADRQVQGQAEAGPAEQPDLRGDGREHGRRASAAS